MYQHSYVIFSDATGISHRGELLDMHFAFVVGIRPLGISARNTNQSCTSLEVTGSREALALTSGVISELPVR